MAFGYGCENFAKYEQQGVGIQWSNMNRSPEDDKGYTFTLSICMMLIDAALYWTLTWYIENVFPGGRNSFAAFSADGVSCKLACGAAKGYSLNASQIHFN